MNIGFVGTGKMGGQFARRLLEAGHDLSVYDLRREATTSLCELGAHLVEGPRAAAQEAEIVLTSLPNPGAVEAVALDPDNGIIAGMRSGGTYADLSTSPPWLSVKVAAAFRAAGKRALDTPVSNGGVFMTIGGDPDAFTEYRPVFETISQNVYYMGAPGMGQVAKLVRQYVAFAAFTAESEAMLIAAKAGAPMETMADFMTKSVGTHVALGACLAVHSQRRFRDPLHRDIGHRCQGRQPGCGAGPPSEGAGGCRPSRQRHAGARPGPGMGPAQLVGSGRSARRVGSDTGKDLT